MIVNHMHPRISVSRRAVLRGLTSSAAAIALGGCASLALTGDRFDAAELTVNPTLLVATTRKPVKGARSKPWFGPERSARMTLRARNAHAARRRPLLARLGWARRMAPRCDRDGAAGRRPVRAGDRTHATCSSICTASTRHSRWSALSARAPRRRHPIPRRDHGVLLAIQGRSSSITAMTARARCGRATPWSRCSSGWC